MSIYPSPGNSKPDSPKQMPKHNKPSKPSKPKSKAFSDFFKLSSSSTIHLSNENTEPQNK